MGQRFRVVKGYTARDRRGWWGKGRKCQRLKCVPSRIGAQSPGCPTNQVKRCATYGRPPKPPRRPSYIMS